MKSTKAGRAARLIGELARHTQVEKCSTCECLTGALLQVKLDHPKLAPEVDELMEETTHACLGCDKCPPGELLTGYLREAGNGEEKK